MNSTSVISPLFDILPNICNEEFRSKLNRGLNSSLRFYGYSPASYIELEEHKLDITYHWTYKNCDWSSIVIQDDGVVDIYFLFLKHPRATNEASRLTFNINLTEEELFMMSTVDDIKEITMEDIKIIKNVWSLYFEKL